MARDVERFVTDAWKRDQQLRRLTLWAMEAVPRPFSETGLELVDPFEWLDFAERNEVGPIVAHALLGMDDGNVSMAHRARAEAVHAASEERMSVLMAELDRVGEHLATAGIPMVGLKNAGIARGIYPCPACCPMGDIDTLIERDRFREAHTLVEEAGFRLASRASVESGTLEDGLHSGGTEYVKTVGDHEVWLELQWRAVAGRWIRPDQEPQSADLLRRSVSIEGSPVRLLSPTDNMIQVGLHTAKHSYVRAPGLRLHTDVDRLARFASPDWEQVVRIASELRIKTAVFFSLALAKALLGTEIPEPVLEALGPSRWKREVVARWVGRADVFEPAEHKFNRPEMMVFHALLYDSMSGLLASVFDADPDELGIRYLPRNLRTGFRRVKDIVTRYQA